jgi:hypothetical protein
MLALLAAACGRNSGDAVPDARVESSPPPPAAAVSTPAQAVPESRQGGAAFAVDGRAMRFDALPSGHNYYTPMASQVTARPRVDAAEQLSITFAAMDLLKLDFPAEVPRPRMPSTPLDPLSSMAGVGFSYRTEDGVEWAGPGRVHIDRFGRDGVIEGRFDDVSLPHTEKQLPNLTLTAGSFRARISDPW